MMRFSLFLMIIMLATPALAGQDRLVTIDTRPGVTVSFYSMKREGAKATVVLMTGGAGGIGMKNGIPTSQNFLVRSRDLFAAHGFNVAIIGKPSDQSDLDGSFRISREHIEDLRSVVAFLKKDAGQPVWIVGTSMGTISAASAAIALNEELGGIVLTSSITSQKKVGAVPWQNLGAIRIPVLVVHHERDACKICDPSEVSLITSRLTNAPIRKAVFVNGGSNPTGNPCEALHWHGYIGMEQEAVDLISSWIKHPAP
jgi:pimeloyl-ACP methyl ester carboxylesterase